MNTHLVFEPEKKNVTFYATPFGQMEMGIAATKIAVQEEEENLSVSIDYALEINRMHTADCQLHVHVQSKEAGDFRLCS